MPVVPTSRPVARRCSRQPGVAGPAVFAQALQTGLSRQGVPVTLDDALGAGSAGLPQTVLMVTKTLAHVAGQLIGEVESIRAEFDDAGESGGSVRLTIACGAKREGLENLDHPAQVVFKPGVSALTVVDWLYMEKIIELQGGKVEIHHDGGRAAGFLIVLPTAAA